MNQESPPSVRLANIRYEIRSVIKSSKQLFVLTLTLQFQSGLCGRNLCRDRFTFQTALYNTPKPWWGDLEPPQKKSVRKPFSRLDATVGVFPQEPLCSSFARCYPNERGQ